MTRPDLSLSGEAPVPAATARSLALVCPHCLNPEGTVKLDLNDLPTCECSECSETFTPAEAAARFAELAEAWRKAAAWIDQAPAAV
jgi:hypothetical protein